MPDDTNNQTPYHFYENNGSFGLNYNQPNIHNYPGMPHATQTRDPMVTDLHQSYPLPFLQQPHTYPTSGVFPASPPHANLSLSNSPRPPSPEMYEALSPPLSGSDTSGDGLHHYSTTSSGANSPSSSRGHSLVHRTSHRYNPTPSPTSSSSRHKRGRSQDSDDEDNMGVAYVENLANSRKEATRRQRIEAEQRRRDELRDGYAKLKDALPLTNQKSSKVSLLERATNHIIALERENKELQNRIAYLEQESQRLRALNEKISLSAEGTPAPDANRPPTPQDAAPRGPQASASGRSTPSASEGGH
ncbi:hypothetical protein CVT24_002405 [Panaeolus cyanescens]|uniref:BHLH domain-containing protein n=1 Tax=Panaeolus cyanescens TaxID=181874 RepID=A0A409W0U0_9AGAR|nr:hypothetical protein CVT24_002405 [Panaeolus cyanescens]